MVDADEGQAHGDPTEALVHEDVAGSAVGDPQDEAGTGDSEVDDSRDPAPGDVGEGVLADVAADVELVGQLVADLVLVHGSEANGTARALPVTVPARLATRRGNCDKWEESRGSGDSSNSSCGISKESAPLRTNAMTGPRTRRELFTMLRGKPWAP